MKQCNTKKKIYKNNGITLIALALTIIVLLILAGVALSLALGDNGLMFKARQSQQDQEIALEKDRIMAAYGASFTNKYGKFNKETFEQELKNQGVELDGEIYGDENAKPLKLNLKTKHSGYILNYEIDDNTILVETQIIHKIPSDLKVGDIIIYDPTKGVTDASKLTYTSQKGTAKTGGNGHNNQTITAKSNQNEWIVLSKANNQIKVISKEVIGDVNGGVSNQFTLYGGIGWLYAEEEFHKACSIYGYGKGARKTITKYKIGNYRVLGDSQTRTLTGSGARSMTLEDVAQIMKGDAYTDFTEDEKKFFTPVYMQPSRKSPEVSYPTISSTEDTGTSITKQRFDHELYVIYNNSTSYDKELVPDVQVNENKQKLKNHIFKNNKYWIGSRYIYSYYTLANFNVNYISTSYVLGSNSFQYDSSLNVYTISGFLRPVVFLDAGMIEKVSEGKWKRKDWDNIE
ncbi:MAG: hypothetical protein ACTTGJ_02130 [Clostridium sp.]